VASKSGNRLTGDDICRLPPRIQEQIARQMEEQGSFVPLPKVRKVPKAVAVAAKPDPFLPWFFGGLTVFLLLIAAMLVALNPY
jgi:hypothetical protein